MSKHFESKCNQQSRKVTRREKLMFLFSRRIIVPLRFADTLPRRDLFYLGDVRWFDAFSPPPEQHL
jgi:hypothetical protein